LPEVLYGSKTRSLILREGKRLRLFANRVLGRIFGLKRDEVRGGWRKLHNKELHKLHSSPSIIKMIKSRRIRWTGHIARMGEKRTTYRLVVGKLEGKKPLGRPRRGWVDTTQMNLRDIGQGGLDYIDVAQDRDQWRDLVNTVMNVRVHES
jgi:hypothetical protein